MARKLHEANARIADWGGFTAEEMAEHALGMGCSTEVTCPDAKAKAAVLRALKGKPGANRVEVFTLDEYEARTLAAFEHIKRTSVTPETTNFGKNADVDDEPGEVAATSGTSVDPHHPKIPEKLRGLKVSGWSPYDVGTSMPRTATEEQKKARGFARWIIRKGL